MNGRAVRDALRRNPFLPEIICFGAGLAFLRVTMDLEFSTAVHVWRIDAMALRLDP
jgi:hypothetical protein